MLNASNIIGMQIISLYEGQVLGYVKNIILSKDYKKINAFVVMSNLNEENILYLPARSIYKIKEVILITNATKLSKDLSYYKTISPINHVSYLSNGSILGKINDITFDDCLKIINYSTSISKNFTYKIAKITQNIIIFDNEDSKMKTSRFKPKQQKNITPQNVISQNLALEETNKKSNYNFLLGRKVIKNIINNNNVVLIKFNTVITPTIVEIAKSNNKLRELAINS